MGILFSCVLVALILKSELGKVFLLFFGIACLIYFITFQIPRPWLLLTVVGLLLCYELLEFSFRHDVPVGDEELHQKLMRNHLLYLAIVFSFVLGASFGTLFLFERIALRFSESIYINALVFSLIFFAVLYFLRYTSK